jgi:hypothetical protein
VVLCRNAVCIYQPVFGEFLKSEAGREHLAGDWVKNHAADYERGLGKLFLQRDGAVQPLGDDACLDWLASKGWKPWQVISRIPPHIYGRLSRDFERGIGLYASSERRKKQRMHATMARRLDTAMLKNIGRAAEEMKDADPEI